MTSKAPLIYKNVFTQLINSLIHVPTSFLLPFIIPKPSSMNLSNMIGHLIFMILPKNGAKLVPNTIPKIC